MRLSIEVLALLVVSAVASTVNEPCVGKDDGPGGTTITGACPKTPDNVKCCTKPSCGSAQQALEDLSQDLLVAGNCRWQSDCKGTSLSGQCPGPASFKCCQSSEDGCGGYDGGNDNYKGGCTDVAIKGAEAIKKAWPGRIREIGCKRNDPGSDHDNGTATDILVSDALEQATMCGEEIAEWVMRNAADLEVKYVIWGQKIWNRKTRNPPDQPKSWSEWRAQEPDGKTGMRVHHW
ncbi:hypothetical protein LTR05_006878 [Lithohypha guttulata]|uniref:ARB-07466-like C-terminal domain-containing protein n=1 Tax=Lithohypha guttulata TaxID=1690604 RepID=A0AAN7SVX5_9EURO|nr:hypothetical protein LTR05_006878 [Lithohypha guttulata]